VRGECSSGPHCHLRVDVLSSDCKDLHGLHLLMLQYGRLRRYFWTSSYSLGARRLYYVYILFCFEWVTWGSEAPAKCPALKNWFSTIKIWRFHEIPSHEKSCNTPLQCRLNCQPQNKRNCTTQTLNYLSWRHVSCGRKELVAGNLEKVFRGRNVGETTGVWIVVFDVAVII